MEVPDNFLPNQIPNVYGKTLKVPLWYPKQNINEIEIQLIDLRWPDSIKVRYDFDRDGWIILQSNHDETGFEIEQDWKEVAFIPAQYKWEDSDELHESISIGKN